MYKNRLDIFTDWVVIPDKIVLAGASPSVYAQDKYEIQIYGSETVPDTPPWPASINVLVTVRV